MKRIFLTAFLLACFYPAFAQKQQTGDQTITSSGSSVSTPYNAVLGTKISTEENILGVPSAMSIVVAGCTSGDVCSTLNTYTGTTDTVVGPLSTGATVYDHFKFTATWTGYNVSVNFKWTITGAQQVYPTASGGTSVKVNDSTVDTPNFNATTPAAEAGYTNAKVQASGSNVSVEVTTPIAASALDTDSTMAADSDANVPSQKAVKTALALKQADLGATAKTGSGTEVPGMTTASLAAGDVVQYDGSKFVNATPGNLTVNKVDGNSIASGDRLKRVYCTGAGTVALSLAQAGASFPDGWAVEVFNKAVGNCTITATTSKIYSPSDPTGSGSVLVLIPGAGAKIQSDATNYHAMAAGNTIASAALPAANTALGAVKMAAACGAGNHISSIGAGGELTCSADAGGTDTIQLNFFSGSSAVAGSGTSNLICLGTAQSTSNETICEMPMVRAGTIKNLHAITNAAPTAGQTYQVKVRYGAANGTAVPTMADTSPLITCTISGTEQVCSDTSNTKAVSAGDFISVMGVPSTTATGGRMIVALELQ